MNRLPDLPRFDPSLQPNPPPTLRIKLPKENHMGQRVEFPSNGHTCQGYFAAPESGTGPAVVVIQEWWGLVPHIEDLVNRFAGAGFCAVAPDLFHGKTTKLPDEAVQKPL